MNRAELKQIAENGKRWMLTSFCAFLDHTDANAGYVLTQHAIRAGYVSPRPPVYGRTVQDWRTRGNAPLWACKAACDMLVESGFVPVRDEQLAILAYYWLRGHGPFDDVDEALAALPTTLPAGKVERYVEAAFFE